MSALQDYYNTGDDGEQTFYAGQWAAQSFKPSANYNISSVKLKLRRFVASTGTVTVSIRETSTGKPTGGDLCFGTIDVATGLPTSSGWVEITFGSSYSLVSGTTYAIVVRSDNGGSTLRWSSDNSSPTYSDGFYSYSSDGSSWTGSAAADMMFEIWGTVPTNHEAAGLISGTGGIIVEAIVNSNHEVAGSISGIGSITGDTNNNWKIEGSIAGTSTPAGEAVVDWLAGGEIAGTGLITGLFFIESYLWAKSRSSSYDKTKVYDEATQTWITADSRGGSRFRNQLIVMAKQDDGNAKLYYSGV